MCLQVRDEVTKTNVTEGYKLYKGQTSMYAGFYHNAVYTMGNTYKARAITYVENRGMKIEEGEPIGFHVYVNEEEAKYLAEYYNSDVNTDEAAIRLVKVEMGEIVASGLTQGPSYSLQETAIYKTIKLIEEIII